MAQFRTISRATKHLHTDKDKIIALLTRFAVRYGGWTNFDGSMLRPETTAIVAIDRHLKDRSKKYWHWVVFDAFNQRYYDPETRKFMKTFRRKIRYYLPVYPGSSEMSREPK
jgi:hypothetical protein